MLHLLRRNARFIVLSMIMMALWLPVLAVFIQPSQAKSVAKNWLRESTTEGSQISEINNIYAFQEGELVPALAEYRPEIDMQPALYICYTSNGQFVVVSADNNSIPILGYSDLEQDTRHLSPGFVYWMQYYSDQIEWMVNNGVEIPENQARWGIMLGEAHRYVSKTSRDVSPLISTKWAQGWPYNELCPIVPGSLNTHCYTGTGAVMMGQIMKYWSSPTVGVGAHQYYSTGIGMLSANFGATTYQWDYMPDSITTSNISIATLLYHIGVALESNYNSGGEVQMARILVALPQFFSYNIVRLFRAEYSNDVWTTMLKNKLDNGEPFLYRGEGPGVGAHMWIIDGYDNNDMFHMNFGWGGSNNGYYLLNAVNPGSYTFNSNQSALFTAPENYGMESIGLNIQPSGDATVGTTYNLIITTPPILGAWDVTNFGFQLTYDHSKFTYNSVGTNAMMSATGTATVTETTPGNLNVSWTGSTPLLGSGKLISLSFTPYDSGEGLFTLANATFNSSMLGLSDTLLVNALSPTASLDQSAISMTNVFNLGYNQIGTTNLNTTYIVPSWQVNSYQFNVTYVPEKLEFESIETEGTMSHGAEVNVVVSTPGNLVVSCASPFNIAGSGSLLRLNFRGINNSALPSISQVTPTNFMYNNTPLASVSGCTFRLLGYTSNEDEVAVIVPTMEIYPNPFSSSTAIKFNSKSNAPVSFNIYNVKGQLVRQFANNDSKASEIVWDGKDANGNKVAGGIYLVRWEQGKDNGSAKLLILK